MRKISLLFVLAAIIMSCQDQHLDESKLTLGQRQEALTDFLEDRSMFKNEQEFTNELNALMKSLRARRIEQPDFFGGIREPLNGRAQTCSVSLVGNFEFENGDGCAIYEVTGCYSGSQCASGRAMRTDWYEGNTSNVGTTIVCME